MKETGTEDFALRESALGIARRPAALTANAVIRVPSLFGLRKQVPLLAAVQISLCIGKSHRPDYALEFHGNFHHIGLAEVIFYRI
jgi:hypothetical protein